MDMENSKNPPRLLSARPIVTMEELPFYKVYAEIIRPTKLAPRNSVMYKKTKLHFMASPEKLDEIHRTNEVQLGDETLTFQLRFCLWDTQGPQIDHLPRHLSIRVNEKKCFVLKEKESNKHPINITELVHLSDVEPNIIKASWSLNDRQDYAMSLCWVKQLTTSDLLRELRAKDVFPASKTRAMIQEKLAAEAGEATASSFRISLMCPLGQSRMSMPCRALSCSHLQTFDALQYLQRNKEKETWRCPICVKKAYFKNLVVDEFFLNVLNIGPDFEEIEFLPDGSWSPVGPKRNLRDDCNAPGHKGLLGPPPDSNKEIPTTAQMNNSSSIVELQTPATPRATLAAMPTTEVTRPQHPQVFFQGPPQGINLQQSGSPQSSFQLTSTRASTDLNFPTCFTVVTQLFAWPIFTSPNSSDYNPGLPWGPLAPSSAPVPEPAPVPAPVPLLPPAPLPGPGPYSGWTPLPLPVGLDRPWSQQLSLSGPGLGQGSGVPAFQQLVRYQPPAPGLFPPVVQIFQPAGPMGSTVVGPRGGGTFRLNMPPPYLAPFDPNMGGCRSQRGRASSSRANSCQSRQAGGSDISEGQRYL
ncbi:E3 SUMO-protein ligase PIAS3-like isoform X2 [Ornithorhynchus anatinus]|uniref:SP-RING-type domain-containing protein n=1 Tax=Ornithorhynchus anatinus TaxID=9258 RepID=A0A6I8PFF0_ORNAN|nr:E3 SUMO-protein ligase PIAS3-like isoform X2 [Ornithorhynchus anatinus]